MMNSIGRPACAKIVSSQQTRRLPQSASFLTAGGRRSKQSAVDCFIALTHEVYYKTLREYFGDTVVGIFTDEPFERNGDGITVSLPALHGWQCCALVLA